MSNETHDGTGHYCGECMHLELCPDTTPAQGRIGEECRACGDFILSIEAQRLEQAKIANEIALHRALTAAMARLDGVALPIEAEAEIGAAVDAIGRLAGKIRQ